MDFDLDDWRNCPQRRHHPEHRTYGPNIPEYMQGMVVPGDEAGYRCRISGDLCETRPDCEECPLCS